MKCCEYAPRSLSKLRETGSDVTALNTIRTVAGDAAVADRRAVWLALANLVRSLPDQDQCKGKRIS